VVYTGQIPLLVSGVLDPATGLVTAPSTSDYELIVSEAQIPGFARGKWMQFTAELGTGTAPGAATHPVKLLSDATLQVRIGLSLDVHLEL